MDESLKRNNFDLLRILAALQVLVVHGSVHLGIPGPAGSWMIEAFPGVPIFFSMSGFLISASFERSPEISSYTRNRFLRILPGLWCCIIVTTVICALTGIDFFNVQALVWFVSQLAGIIYTPTFLSHFGFGSYNGSLWTIPIELQFYVLLPVLYFWIAGRRYASALFWLALAIFIVIAYTCYSFASPLTDNEHGPIAQKLLRYSFLPHFYLFLTGVLLQRLAAYRSRWIRGKGFLWLALYLTFHYFVPWSAATYFGGAILLAIAAVALAYTAPGLSAALLRGNDLSYGVYIYHGLLVNLMIEQGLVHRPVYLLLLAVCSFAAAYASWILVEKPFLRKKRNPLSPSPA